MHAARLRRALAVPILAAAACIAPRDSFGSARQIHFAPTLGFALIFAPGASAGPGGSAGLHVAYDITDAFRVYGQFEYSLTTVPTMASTGIRHGGTFAAGIAYAIDVTTVVPWFGIGLQTNVFGQPGWTGLTLGPEVRGGADILASRYVGMTIQVAYGLQLFQRDRVSDVLSVLAGLRLTLDL